jgi:glycosyltransferase involved in cell wall biosynthesis
MRIAYVINSVEGGGAALPVPAVAGVLRDHGASVEVFALTRRDGRATAAMTDAGLTVHVRPGGEKDHAAATAWLGRAVRDWDPDLIWTSLTRATLLGQLVGRLRGTPVVSWQHAAFLKPMNRLLLRAQRDRSALWIADSHSVAQLTRQRLGVPAERLAVWPLFSADPQAPRATAWRPGQPVRLGSLGRLHRVKGYDVLIAALGRMRAQGFRPEAPFELEICGEGAQRGALEADLASHGLDNVRLSGFHERPREFLAGLHLYLQPSRSEGLCIAAHEAMQAGLPTVVSAVGEMPFSVVDGATGHVARPGDAQALAQALMRLLSDPGRLAAMGEAARIRVLDRFGAHAFARAGADVMARLPLTVSGVGGGAPPRSPARLESGLSASRR